MHPVLLDINVFNYSLTIKAYSFFLSMAVLVTFSLGLLIAIRRSLPRRSTMICMFATIIAVPVGARLMHAATNTGLYAREPERFFSLHPIGFALYGGLILAVVIGLAACRVQKLDVWIMADSMVPAIGLGIAFVRLGCYLNGCCFGETTSLPWGVTFPPGSSAFSYQLEMGLIEKGLEALFMGMSPVHPTQLYELLAALIGAMLALLILRRKARDGTAFLIFAMWFTAFRWFNDGLRVPGPGLTAPTWFFPLIYGAIIVACTVPLILRIRRKQGSAYYLLPGGVDRARCLIP